MKYRYKRNPWVYESLAYIPTGKYDMPIIKATPYRQVKFDNLITFNYVNSCKNPADTWVYFYIDDYQFERIWNDTPTAIETLKKFKGVIAPDFSAYRDWPTPLKMYNVWRSKVLTWLFQEAGINVIPNVQWIDFPSYLYCFEGLPKNSVVAVSTNGCLKEKVARQLFIDGFKMMQASLTPSQIIVIGSLPDELVDTPNIEVYSAFTAKFGKSEHNLAYKG